MNIRIISALFVSLILLSACGGSSSGDDNASNSISVLTVSGGTITLDGNYVSQCHLSDDGQAYLVFSLGISGSNLVMTLDAYTNSNCDGAPVQSQSAGLSLTATSTTISTTGWTNGNSVIISPPNASDASGQLSDIESVTLLEYTVTSSGIIFTQGQTGQTFVVIDDTSTMPVLYFSDGYPATSLVETIPTYVKQ